MRPIDETYLQPHEATRIWWKQSSTCALCKHQVDAEPGGGRRCAVAELEASPPAMANPKHAPNYGASRMLLLRGVKAFCIDARLGSGPCGPGAKLFQPL